MAADMPDAAAWTGAFAGISVECEMTNMLLLRAAAADFTRQCDALDEQCAAAEKKGMQDAFAALLRGDTAERDRIIAAIRRLPEATAKAKLEIGLRIGERIGLDRDGVEREFLRAKRVN